jgi:sensor domain CHASE-containing protein
MVPSTPQASWELPATHVLEPASQQPVLHGAESLQVQLQIPVEVSQAS